MTPGVPFPLLAGVELLVAGAVLGLVCVACTRRAWSRSSPALVLGGLVLVVAEVVTALPVGAGWGSELLWTRALGFALVGAGVWLAGRQGPSASWPPGWRQRPRRERPGPELGHVSWMSGGASLSVVVPLGGGVPPATAATLSGLAATFVAVQLLRTGATGRRLPAGLLAGGLLLLSAACAVTPLAEGSSTAALGVLALPACGALVLFGLFAVLARFSVLGKVAGTIVAVGLAVNIAAVSVISAAVAAGFAQAQTGQAQAVASGRLRTLLVDLEQTQRAAELVAQCPSEGPACNHVLPLAEPDTASVAALVTRDGRVRRLNGPPLPAEEAAELIAQPRVREVLDAPPGTPSPKVGDLVQLTAGDLQLAMLSVAPVPADPSPEGAAAGVWLVPLDTEVLESGARLTGGFDLSVLLAGSVVSTSLDPSSAASLERVVQESGGLDLSSGHASGHGSGHPTGHTILAAGDDPLVHLTPLPLPDGQTVAVLAVSLDAAAALAPERAALTRVVVVAVALTLALAGAGIVVSRQLVKPVRQLTAAAARVSEGDLEARTGVSGQDEVGSLAHAFDTMTASVSDLTAGLRHSVKQESGLRTHLETVLRSLSDGVVVTDEAGVVTRVNPAALAILGGVDEELVLGRPLWAVGPLRGLDLPEVGQGEGEISRADGTTLPVALAATPLAGGGGRVLVIRDQTREREVERLKTEFLSNVSHELRTPLTPIRGYSDLLLRKRGLPEEKRVLYAAAVLEACLRLTKVVDLLVDVAALEAGRIQPEHRDVDAGALLQGRLETWRTRSPGRADDLRLVVEPGLPRIVVDSFWLGRALDELFDNAVKHTTPGIPVTVAAESWSKDWVALIVRDTGPGIPSGDRSRMLGSFEQADGSTTRTAGGLGLGLAFVHRLCETFGFKMRLESERGWGTVVQLLVPAEQRSEHERPLSPAGAEPASAPARTRRLPPATVTDTESPAALRTPHPEARSGESPAAPTLVSYAWEASDLLPAPDRRERGTDQLTGPPSAV